jgi:hypothetical protein
METLKRKASGTWVLLSFFSCGYEIPAEKTGNVANLL